MLSIANISSSAAAAKYHEEDDYYAEGSIEHQNLSQWLGQGAKKLGLSGKVDSEEFKRILDGLLPDGTQIGKKNDKGEVTHAPGIDMTFSAPKSVSIMAEVAGDNKIYDLHQDAVKKALSYAEDNLISTRIKVGDKVIKQKTPNIIAAIFRHSTSRNLDPQLHTHCVIANIVERGDGQWKSAFHGEIFDNKMLLGVIYRAELARGLEEVGYTIERTHEDGRFEITGIPSELSEFYSSRSQEIKEALKSYDFKNAKTAADATLKTREKKKVLDRETIGKIWENVLEKSGQTKENLFKLTATARDGKALELENVKNIPVISKNFLQKKWDDFLNSIGFAKEISHINNEISKAQTSEKDIAKLSLESAIKHLAERESVFEKKQILATALSYGIGKISLDALVKTFNDFVKKEILLPAKDQNLKNFFTTKEELETEIDSIKMMKEGRGKEQAITTSEKLNNLLAESTLNKNQREAAELILTSKDQVIGVQGFAGVGKTYTLKTVKEIAQKNDYKFLGMAPSASAARTLQDESGIPSQTVHKFLFKYDGLIHGRGTDKGLQIMQKEMKGTILVLDESSLASSKIMNSFLKVVTKLNLRAVMVGDVKQLGAIEAGKPFYQLQKAGMKTATMDQIIRQKEMNLKSAVEATIKGEIRKAFQRIVQGDINQILEEKNPRQIAARVVAELMKLDVIERSKTLVLAPANETREAINLLVREELQKQGLLGGAEINVESFQQKDFSRQQKITAKSYSVGDFVLFNKDYKSLNIESGEYLKVSSVDQKKGIVWLEKSNGKLIGWDPEKVGAKRVGVVEVYDKKKINLKEGEKIFWTRNSKKNRDIINSGIAHVKKIETDHVIFTDENGKNITLRNDQSELKHLDYGYSSTVFSAQGKTADNVIAVAESHREYLTNQKSFYVTISRARNKVTLIVDDKQKVAEKLHEYTGGKISALESQKVHEHHVHKTL